jgi:hypothetical protein
MPTSTRHILALSGGKDSTALAIYLRDRVPEMEYVFCDTHKELPETYEYLLKIECFFQRKNEWVGLKERHPDLFELAKAYEKIDPATGVEYTWNDRESLADLEKPERIAEIRQRYAKAVQAEQKLRPNRPLVDVLREVYEDESDDKPCFFCHT